MDLADSNSLNNEHSRTLQGVIQSVEGLKATLGPLPGGRSGHEAPRGTLEDYVAAGHQLKQLAYLSGTLQRAVSLVAQHHAALERHHAAWTAALKKALGGTASGSGGALSSRLDGPSSISRDASAGDRRGSANDPPLSTKKGAGSSQPAAAKTTTMCEVTPGVFLEATVVTSFGQVAQNGTLFYIAHCDHFAIRLNGKLFHGNVGCILPPDRALERVRDCRRQPCNDSPCDFYHDPIKHAGRKDRRNYVASSWQYTSTDTRRAGDTRGRKLGSCDCLNADLAQISAEDAERFKDQTFHDLLCALCLR